MNSAATRNPHSPLGMVAALAAATVGLAFVVVLQLGHRINSSDGTWLPANPLETVKAWFDAGQPWSAWHTSFAVLMTLLLFAAMTASAFVAARRRRARDHIDAKARLLGRGQSMTLKTVTKENQRAGYTNSDIAGMYLAKLVLTGADLYAGWRSTVLAIMGTGSGKTSALAVRNAYNAPGWVYGTSNKRDFTDPIWGFRAKRGKVRVFDPQGIADAPPDWYWDPLSYVTDDVHAKILVQIWADAGAKQGDGNSSSDPFFENAGRDVAAALLLAAAMGGYPVSQVLRWIAQPDRDDPVDLLRRGNSISPTRPRGWELMAEQLQGAYDMNVETKRGVFGNAAQIVSFLVNESAQKWVCKLGPDDERPAFDPHEFVRSAADTLISLSAEGTGTLGPLVASLTNAVMEAAEEYAKRCPGGRLAVPGVFILDEAANVVRDKTLPDKYSHYASRGLYIITILQSYAQGEAAWGKLGMSKLMGAATHVLIGRGIKDESFLKQLSELIGQHDELHYSTGSSASGSLFANGHSSRSTNSNFQRVPILHPADLHSMPEWRALIFASGERPVLVELIPYFRDPKAPIAIAVRESVAKHGYQEPVSV
jgi:type IV secretory pathway TraG/TraD family ATPase VirD4